MRQGSDRLHKLIMAYVVDHYPLSIPFQVPGIEPNDVQLRVFQMLSNRWVAPDSCGRIIPTALGISAHYHMSAIKDEPR